MGTCCCSKYIKDVKPRPLDPLDIYQQVQINHKKHQGFTAVSVAQDGFPPNFLRRKYWDVHMRTPRHYQLDEAPGLDSSLRARLPNFNFSPSNLSSETVVVGKWYTPFVFVKEDYGRLKEQMKKSMFYEVTLEQRWDKIFECDNAEKVVYVDVVVDREVACVDEKEAVCDWGRVDNGVIWFRSAQNNEGQDSRLLGLNVLVVERMRWEQERAGFRYNEFERQVKVKRTEEFEGKGEWRKFGCYVLVERFVFKRMDGSVLLTHDFRHTSQIRCKWE